MNHRIVTRAEWGSRNIPEKDRHRIALPAQRLWLHHTVTNAPHDAASVRQIQRFHMDTRGWTDIAYSWLVAPTGLIFEGRGWGIAGGHTAGDNSKSHAICAMGNYEHDAPTEALLDSVAWLTAEGHRREFGPAQITGGHQQAPGASTACPGNHLMSALPDLAKRTAAYLGQPTTPTPKPKDWLDMATKEEVRQIIREEIQAETGPIRGFIAAVLEAAEKVDAEFFGTGARRLRDRAGHLNPYRKK